MDTIPTTTPSTENPAQPATTPRAQRYYDAIGHSQDMLFTARTVFPFSFFPDTVTVDREKVTIVNRTFFRVAEIVSTRIHDVLNVTADVGPFFGAVHIHTRYFDNDSYSVKFLRRTEALRLKRILQGYVIACQKGIDCEKYTTKELAQLLDDIGEGHPSKGD